MISRMLPFFVMFALLGFFFFPLILKGEVPMPAEALVEHYFPWNTVDYGVTGAAPIATDVFRQQLPWISLVVDEIKNGRWPLWNPYNFAGMPLLANLQSHVFHPSTLLFLFFPLIPAWVAFIISVPLVAGFSMYVYLRVIGRSRLAATFGAVGWMGASFIILWLPWGFIPYGIITLPLFLWFLEKLLVQQRWMWLPLFVLLLAIELVSGYVQVIVYTLGVTVLYWFFKRQYMRQFTVIFITFVIAIGLASIQLLPSWEAYQLSNREGAASAELYYQYQLEPKYFATLLTPSYFGNPMTHNLFAEQYQETMLFVGVVIFFFALIAIFARRKDRREWFFILLGGVALLFALDTPFADLPIRLNIPVLSSGIPSRIIVLVQFALIVLAAYGVDQWRKAQNRATMRAWFSLLVFLLILWSFAFRTDSVLSQRALFIPTIIIGFITIALILRRFFPKFTLFVVCCLLVVAIGEATHFFHRNITFADPTLIYPKNELLLWMQENQGIDRHYGEGPSTFDHNFSTFYRMFSTEGFDSLYPKRYGELLQSAATGELPDRVLRSDANLPKEQNERKARLLQLLGVKYIFHQEGLLDQEFGQKLRENSTPLFREGETVVLENFESLPRAFLADSYEFIQDREALIGRLYDPRFNLRRTILLEERPLLEPELSDHVGVVNIDSFLPSSLELHVQTPSNQLLFLSDQWYPGWVARIDGGQTPIYRANDSFRAISVPQGEHEVVFSYEPESFKLGMVLTSISFIFWIGGSIVILSRAKNVKQQCTFRKKTYSIQNNFKF